MSVAVEYQQDTVDTGDPCYEVRIDSDNWMHLVHDKEKDRLVISHVWTDKSGQFSNLMDKAVEKLGTNQIMFTMVINSQLQKSLEGFEEDKIYHEKLEEEMTVLKGEWEQ